MKTIHRISEFIKSQNLSLNAFDKSIGRPAGYTGKQIRSEASVGSDILETILLTYKEINPQWLISGEGEMLRESGNLTPDNNFSINEPTETYSGDLFENLLLSYLDKGRVRNKILEILIDGKEK